MTRYLPTEAQEWRTIEVVGIPMQACRLWEGEHNVKSGLLHMPQGMTVPTHHHPYWCQIDVVKGTMEVQLEGEEPHTIATGGYYFVEPGDTHRETALTDTLLLTICEEDRPEFRGQGLRQLPRPPRPLPAEDPTARRTQSGPRASRCLPAHRGNGNGGEAGWCWRHSCSSWSRPGSLRSSRPGLDGPPDRRLRRSRRYRPTRTI